MKLKEQKGGFLRMLLGTSGVSLLGNTLAGKGIVRAEDSAMVKTKKRSKKQGKGTVRAGYGNKTDF